MLLGAFRAAVWAIMVSDRGDPDFHTTQAMDNIIEQHAGDTARG